MFSGGCKLTNLLFLGECKLAAMCVYIYIYIYTLSHATHY